MKNVVMICVSLLLSSLAHAVTVDCSQGVQMNFSSGGVEVAFSGSAYKATGQVSQSEQKYTEYELDGWVLKGVQMDAAVMIVDRSIFSDGKGQLDVISLNEGYSFADSYQCVLRK